MSPLLPAPDLQAIGDCIARIERGERGPRMDAAIMAARGFEVLGAYAGSRRGQFRAVTRGGLPWMRIPPITTEIRAAKSQVPYGWHWGVSERPAPHGWCLDPRAPTSRFFEGGARTVELALVRAGLYATRLVLLDH